MDMTRAWDVLIIYVPVFAVMGLGKLKPRFASIPVERAPADGKRTPHHDRYFLTEY